MLQTQKVQSPSLELRKQVRPRILQLQLIDEGVFVWLRWGESVLLETPPINRLGLMNLGSTLLGCFLLPC